ncbi:GYDIA family GHMP kinase [Salinimicrobium gaetbulicola]|uniref:GYDIA family GHMP kinase n=1 Tax=Salinimicrobium gaetbulicola TaxID=999702 RepID=A0ABW3IIU6_9FLAO
MQTFHSHGKLLITGEYVVLDGATALALPTKYGQTLKVELADKPGISWTSIDHEGKTWFEKTFSKAELTSSEAIDQEVGKIEKRLLSVLRIAIIANPDMLSKEEGYKVTTETDFPLDWGLGTSSTLIANVAKWFNIDAYKLLEKTFGGSGYDVAVAMQDHPITYELSGEHRSVLATSFNPTFKDKIFFVYLNQKQNSRESIAHYKKQDKQTLLKAVEKISSITHQVITCTDISEFNLLLEIHENVISQLINLPKIKTQLFQDYQGTVKSLGGWGGDFVMATGGEKEKEYFRSKGYDTIIPYSEMIL